MDSFVGCVISLHCGDVLGTYQGLVSSFDQVGQTITITKAFRNGIQCKVSSVTISARDITDLKILKTKNEAMQMPEVRLAHTTKPTHKNEPVVSQTANTGHKLISSRNSDTNINGNARKNNRTPTESGPSKERTNVYSNGAESGGISNRKQRCNSIGTNEQRTRSASPGKNQRLEVQRSRCEHVSPADINQRGTGQQQTDPRLTMYDGQGADQLTAPQDMWMASSPVQCAPRGAIRSSPSKMDNRALRGRGGAMQQRNKECFSAPVDTFLDTEFDFEKNLALFDKCAVFEEIENQSGVKVVKPSGRQAQEAKYKCDENVLPSKPATMKQISVAGGEESGEGMAYVTDSGLLVPCVTYDVRQSLLCAAQEKGLGVERQVEAVGRSAAEMVMQLLGGSQRLSPQNAHQKPAVVVLCGPHAQGAQVANCARHLAMHNVKVTVFLACPPAVVSQPLQSELELLQMTSPKQAASIPELPTGGVDMVISGVENPGTEIVGLAHGLLQGLTQWVRTCRAPLLAIDPPAQRPTILTPKWAIGVGLPLIGGYLNSAQLYLCDLGIPTHIYKRAGIKYTSPFGHKFLIPLYLKST